MGELTEIIKTLGGMPAVALIVIVVLASFGLAAYAISAVVKITGRGSNGE
jgi:hypothetical protein